MIHATLNESNICIGYGDLSTQVSSEFLVYLPEGWNEDFLWRKWDGGQWSADKFEPVVTPTFDRISVLESQVDQLTITLGDLMLGGM